MIVCICRQIDDQDYTKEELKEIIMADNFQCGQCQLYYELGLDQDNGQE